MEQRGAAPPDPPRVAPPPGVVLRGGRAVFFAPLFLVLSLLGGAISTFNGAWRGQLICAIIFAIALVVAIVARGWRRADLRLWRNGAACEGVVVDAHRWGANDHISYTVEYQYQVDGRVFRAHRGTDLLWEQKLIWVVHDPVHAERSIPVR